MVDNSASFHSGEPHALWRLLSRQPRSVETALIDFHTHSAASDGALSPDAVIRRAIDAGVTKLALTDHDTIAGYLSVREQVPSILRLISGVELSCQWGSTGVHIVGLGFDLSEERLQRHLRYLNDARQQRAVRIGERLAKLGVTGALDGALAVAGGAQIGRPHFAAWMVQAGFVEDEATAFKKYLGRGKPGDISVLWPSLIETVQALTDSGGTAVLAHPLEYRLTATKLRALCDDFCAAGGKAIEVINGKPDPRHQDMLWRLVRDKSLMVSVGSDFHRDTSFGPGLGIDVSKIPEGLGVWECL